MYLERGMSLKLDSEIDFRQLKKGLQQKTVSWIYEVNITI